MSQRCSACAKLYHRFIRLKKKNEKYQIKQGLQIPQSTSFLAARTVELSDHQSEEESFIHCKFQKLHVLL